MKCGWRVDHHDTGIEPMTSRTLGRCSLSYENSWRATRSFNWVYMEIPYKKVEKLLNFRKGNHSTEFNWCFYTSFKAKSQRAIRLNLCESIFIIFAPSYVNSSCQNRFKCCNLHDLIHIFLHNGVVTTLSLFLYVKSDNKSLWYYDYLHEVWEAV